MKVMWSDLPDIPGLLEGPEIKTAINAATLRAATIYRARARRGKTGQLATNVTVAVRFGNPLGGRAKPRPYGVVTLDADYSAAVDFGHKIVNPHTGQKTGKSTTPAHTLRAVLEQLSKG